MWDQFPPTLPDEGSPGFRNEQHQQKEIMNKFIRTIVGNADGIKAQRASVLAIQAKQAQEALIADLKRKLTGLDLQLVQITDLAPDTTDSLRPGNGFNPSQWAKAVQTLKVDMSDVKLELSIAEETYADWFADVPAAAGTAANA
jgi:hypothetical protein